jgi:hypothetical protein
MTPLIEDPPSIMDKLSWPSNELVIPLTTYNVLWQPVFGLARPLVVLATSAKK